jgi:DNA replication and repair protein RecF
VVIAWGRSHRTSTDSELIRWGSDVARVEGRVLPPDPDSIADPTVVEVALVREGSGGQRKRIRVNGVPRRSTALAGILRTVMFAPEDMLLVAGAPGPRRGSIDTLASSRSPAFAADLGTYSRALQQRNGLLRAIREGTAERDQLRFWDATLLDAGSAVVEGRLATLEALAEPLRLSHAEIAPDEGRLTIRYETNAPPRPGESVRDALTRRLAETAEKEAWNGTTLIGPHRDDLVFELEGRDLAGFASRGQQRTAILALKLAELDVLTAYDGHPPLLLLDDVFSELDPDRRAHLVRRIADLPQAFITTTTLDDLDPALRAAATSWQVSVGPDGAELAAPLAPVSSVSPGRTS